MIKAIYFDMDGTIADLYSVEGWLDYLSAEKTTPYKEAKPLVDMCIFGKILNLLQAQGWKIGIISWVSKTGSNDYKREVAEAKKEWLFRHLDSVRFDEIKIADYGTPKQELANYSSGILFDDELKNRENWIGQAYDVNNIFEILGALVM